MLKDAVASSWNGFGRKGHAGGPGHPKARPRASLEARFEAADTTDAVHPPPATIAPTAGGNQPWWYATKGVSATELDAGGWVINVPPWPSAPELKLAPY
jgi:hypothetical protein